MSASSRKSLAGRADRKLGSGCLYLFFLPFLLVGLGALYGLTIDPALKILAARSWVETPCVIDSSKVESHSDGDGTSYSIEIAYHYTFADQRYTGSRYNLARGSSPGRKSKYAIVQSYLPGAEKVCYVNPNAPQESVLNRGWHWDLAFGGIGLIFVLVGGGGMIFAGRASRRTHSPATGLPNTPLPTGAPEVLRPKLTPMAKFLGILLFAVFWNGFIGVFSYFMVFSEDAHVPMFVKILLGVFELVGVALLVAAGMQFLALFNPRIQITTASTMVPLGGELSFTWTVTGRAGSLRRLRLTLEGAESATYQRGTSNCTDRKVFAELPVFESSERDFLAQGAARVVVPAHLMHTFEARHNKVHWQLKVRGEIPRWPDVEDEYTITVLPLPAHT